MTKPSQSDLIIRVIVFAVLIIGLVGVMFSLPGAFDFSNQDITPGSSPVYDSPNSHLDSNSANTNSNQDSPSMNQASATDNQPTLNLTINGITYTVQLADNPTVTALLKRLPLNLTMQELNNNEKFHYLPEALPAAPTRVGAIHAGDIMLYEDNCLVIFYKSFFTTYEYTPIGHIDDLPSLGRDDVKVQITAIQP